MNPVECSPVPLALGITESRKNISTDSIRPSPKKERERERDPVCRLRQAHKQEKKS